MEEFASPCSQESASVSGVAALVKSSGDAESRGWGSGWPDCQTEKIVPLEVGGVSFPGGIHRDLHELTSLLLGECVRRGYKLRKTPQQNWGYVCREILRSDGTPTGIPSNHSWGLAIDVNSEVNPFGGDDHEMPDWVPDLFNRYGFRWGGDYSTTKDWMHFEYMGSPKSARAHTRRAKRAFGPQTQIRYFVGDRGFNRARKAGRAAGKEAARLEVTKVGGHKSVRIEKRLLTR